MNASQARLLNKVAIVTGASGGIGRAIAIAFAAQGAKLVVCADISPNISSMDEGQRTHEEIRSRFGQDSAVFIRCDVALETNARMPGGPATLEHVIEETIRLGGQLDIMVNNAGILVDMPLHEMSEESWHKAMSVNVTGTFHGNKYAIRQFLRQDPDENAQRGCIINLSSVAAEKGLVGCAAHCATQAAISGLTRGAAVNYAEHGIRVNALCPGYIETSMIEPCLSVPDIVNRWLACTPARKLGRPNDCIGAAVWLACGAESAFVNGSSIVIDGGFNVF